MEGIKLQDEGMDGLNQIKSIDTDKEIGQKKLSYPVYETNVWTMDIGSTGWPILLLF